ncbi:hypothetical protein DHW03_14015 [Pedobacter yonginense]|uniref:Uncharacterized protein n=1 Tax=Pedobacter yonginense TaxID=651869 RepID=A0A317EKL4_9SPHI|nr:hypothetical protein DHW03_14015 [Pedobacter yonginense]
MQGAETMYPNLIAMKSPQARHERGLVMKSRANPPPRTPTVHLPNKSVKYFFEAQMLCNAPIGANLQNLHFISTACKAQKQLPLKTTQL